MNEFLLWEENFDRLKNTKEDEWYQIGGVLYNKNDMEKGRVETFVTYRNNRKPEYLKCQIIDFVPITNYSFKIRVKILDN